MLKTGRNDPCPCGSGRKYKHCCGAAKPVPGARPAREAGRPRGVTLPDGRVAPASEALQIGLQLHNAGRVRKAGEIYQCILQTEPGHADAAHLLGITARQLGNYDVALALIRKAVALRPSTALFHSSLGELLGAMGRLEEAMTACGRAVELGANLPQVHFGLGEILRLQGKNEEAMQCFERAIALNNGYSEAYFKLGDILCSLRRFDEAGAWLQKGLSVHPGDVSLLTAVGIVLRRAGRHDEAIAHYRRVIETHPDVPELYHNLALAYQAEKRDAEAAECFRKVLALRPNDADARHMLDIIERRNTDKAPVEYVRNLFDEYAQKFDQHLVGKLEYRIPRLVGEAIRRCLEHAKGSETLLDLGCGTGLLGVEVQDFAGRLIGVDLSPKMIEKARERSVYDQLVVGDLVETMAGFADKSVDVVAATDVFIYVGNLAPVFEQCRRILRPGGLFAFSVEAAPDDGPDFVLRPTGRYAQARRYISALGTRFGFETRLVESATVRKESGQPVAGYLCVLAVTAEAATAPVSSA